MSDWLGSQRACTTGRVVRHARLGVRLHKQVPCVWVTLNVTARRQRGQRARIFVNSTHAVGAHTVQWHARRLGNLQWGGHSKTSCCGKAPVDVCGKPAAATDIGRVLCHSWCCMSVVVLVGVGHVGHGVHPVAKKLTACLHLLQVCRKLLQAPLICQHLITHPLRLLHQQLELRTSCLRHHWLRQLFNAH